MHSKLKDLYKKYKTRESCQYLFSPKVNLELWHDLSKESKFKDLGLQELQKSIVKAQQPITQLFDSPLKARKREVFNGTQWFATFIGRHGYLSGACLIYYIFWFQTK